LQNALYQQIGQLKIELDWVKKSWTAELRGSRLVELAHREISNSFGEQWSANFLLMFCSHS
jgi:hypothetical protein